VASGADVPPHYDSLIAKIVASGTDRAEFIARMKSALAELRVEDITVNADLHRFVLEYAAFEAGGVTIHDLEERLRRRAEAGPEAGP
jgi:acetyl-CoA carboxylase biotin carboxylase subunit